MNLNTVLPHYLTDKTFNFKTIILTLSQFEDHDNDLMTTLYIYQCKSKHYLTWVLSFCGMKGVFLIFGVFLAWETRNVHYLALNDSKNIGLAVYNIFMFSCLALVIEFVVTYLPLATLVGRSITLVGTTSTICFLFVPKVRHIFSRTLISRRS